MKTSSRALQALATTAILITSTLAPAIAVAEVPAEVEAEAADCELWVPPTFEDVEVQVEAAWTEVIEDAHWQRYSWTPRGGPNSSADPEATVPPHDNWQANTKSDPHGIGAPGPYDVSSGNSGRSSWFYLDWVEAVTEEHAAVYETQLVEVEPGTYIPDPDCTVTELAAPEVVPPSCAAAGELQLPEDTEQVTYSVDPSSSEGDAGTFAVTAEAQEPFRLAEGLTASWQLDVEPQLTPADGCPLARDNTSGITVTSMCYVSDGTEETTIVRVRNNSDHDATIAGIGLAGGDTQVENATLAANSEGFWEIAGRDTIVYDWQGTDADLGTVRGQTGMEQEACHFDVDLAKVWDGGDPGDDFTIDITSADGDQGSLSRTSGETTDDSRVRVPFGGTFSVAETEQPDGWSPISGVGEDFTVPAGIDGSWADFFSPTSTDRLITHTVTNGPAGPADAEEDGPEADSTEGDDGPGDDSSTGGGNGLEGDDGLEGGESTGGDGVADEEAGTEDDDSTQGEDNTEGDEVADDDGTAVGGIVVDAGEDPAAPTGGNDNAEVSRGTAATGQPVTEVLGATVEQSGAARLVRTGASATQFLLLAALSLLVGGALLRRRSDGEGA